jgi:deoxyribose-phosphate aldolase
VTSRSGITKVILEAHYLTLDEIQMVCQVIERVGADFVSNSTGYAPSNVQLKDVELLRSSLSPEIGIKIAGGVNTLDQLLTYRYAGATRVGTLATEQILAQAKDRFST